LVYLHLLQALVVPQSAAEAVAWGTSRPSSRSPILLTIRNMRCTTFRSVPDSLDLLTGQPLNADWTRAQRRSDRTGPNEQAPSRPTSEVG
jgi:hypothetical protein